MIVWLLEDFRGGTHVKRGFLRHQLERQGIDELGAPADDIAKRHAIVVCPESDGERDSALRRKFENQLIATGPVLEALANLQAIFVAYLALTRSDEFQILREIAGLLLQVRVLTRQDQP
jgi:hypothetical protein